MTEEVMKNISLEVVRERLLDHVHQVELGILFIYLLEGHGIHANTTILLISEIIINNETVLFSFQEIPYNIDHRLMGWKELRDGSLRIEQHFITHKQSQRKILVGKNGSKIG
jgi:GTP-binding protein Era